MRAAQQLIRALTLLAYGVAALGEHLAGARSGSASASRDGIRARVGTGRSTHGVNVVVILAGAFIVVRAANLAIDHLQLKLARRHAPADLEWQRRAATLGGILTSLVTVTVGFVAILMLLRELSIDVAADPDRRRHRGAGDRLRRAEPGARRHLRLFPDPRGPGARRRLARINGVAGTVEQINLRTIVLRDGEGAVQVFPNGTITALANLSKQFAYAIVDVRVAYSENMDRVVGTMREVGDVDGAGSACGARCVLAPIEIVGVESLAGGVATIRVKFKTQPLNQGKVANELRRRLMGAFVGRGIKPYGLNGV